MLDRQQCLCHLAQSSTLEQTSQYPRRHSCIVVTQEGWKCTSLSLAIHRPSSRSENDNQCVNINIYVYNKNTHTRVCFQYPRILFDLVVCKQSYIKFLSTALHSSRWDVYYAVHHSIMQTCIECASESKTSRGGWISSTKAYATSTMHRSIPNHRFVCILLWSKQHRTNGYCSMNNI